MKTEIKNPKFRLFIVQIVLLVFIVMGSIVFINYCIDASQVITTKACQGMARLALSGSIIAVPQNYNERVFQVAVIEQIKAPPETIVIGSSRGMYLGKEITGYTNIYNHCVSGSSIEDYYAILGLYYKKFSKLPSRIIIEISPWVFYDNNPEKRWSENITYLEASKFFFHKINGKELRRKYTNKENPYVSIPYFQYNASVLFEKGFQAFKGYDARISHNVDERADLPDGTIRYQVNMENSNPERLNKVKSTNRGVVYKNVHKMKRIGNQRKQELEKLISYLLKNQIEIFFYLQPFSVTQCKYIYEKNSNPVFNNVEKYLYGLGKKYNIKVIGSYDARNFKLSDENFIDFMHLDKSGTTIVSSFFRN